MGAATIMMAVFVSGLLNHVTTQFVSFGDPEDIPENTGFIEGLATCPKRSICVTRWKCPLLTNIIFFDNNRDIFGSNNLEIFNCGRTEETFDYVCCKMISPSILRGTPVVGPFVVHWIKQSVSPTMMASEVAASTNSNMVSFTAKPTRLVRRQIGTVMDLTRQGFQQSMNTFQRPQEMDGRIIGRQQDLVQPQFDMFPLERQQQPQPMEMNFQTFNRQQKGFAQRQPQQQFFPNQFPRRIPNQSQSRFSQPQQQFPDRFPEQSQQFQNRFTQQQFPDQLSQRFPDQSQHFLSRFPQQQFPSQFPDQSQQFSGQLPQQFSGRFAETFQQPQQPPLGAMNRQDFFRSSMISECGIPLLPSNGSNQSEGITAFGEMPWTAAILIRDGSMDTRDNSSRIATRKWVFRCSAVLIHPQLLLTAASCIYPPVVDKMIVRLGDWNLNDLQEPFARVERKIINVFLQDSNMPKPGSNDFAIVEIEYPIDLNASPNINPICLTREVVEWRNSQCVYAAWNYTSSSSTPDEDATLRKAMVQLEWGSSQTCAARLREKQIEYIQGTHCFVQMNSSSCLSDQGGGIFCKAPPESNPQGVMQQKLFLAAVAVEPPSCDFPFDPSFVDVPGLAEETFPHMDWVLRVLDIFYLYPNVQPVTLSGFAES